jgi:UDP-N-acetylglucosamine acyltransferase
MTASTIIVAKSAMIGKSVEIGEGTEIGEGVIIRDGVKIGSNCKIFPYAVIGEPPQDYSFKGETSFIEIGDNNTLREFVTINKAVGEGAKTVIGNNNYIMTYSHIAHNAAVGNYVTIANSVQIAGHSIVEDFVTIGGLAALHQGCRVGKYSMISGMSASSKDLPPYFMYGLTPAIAAAVNRHGLKKHNFSTEAINEIFKAFKLIYKSGVSLPQIIEKLEAELNPLDEIKYLIDFLKNSKRGIKLGRSLIRV